MTTPTDTRQLRLLIMGVLESKMDVVPDGLEFFLTSKVTEYIKATTQGKESPISARERIVAALENGAKRAATLDAIRNSISKGFGINPTGKAWDDFIEFAYLESKKGKEIDKFIVWITAKQNFNLDFWPPVKLQTFWPKAWEEKQGEKAHAF